MFHIFTNDFCRNTTNYFIFSDIFYYCCVRSNNRIITNGDISNYLCSGRNTNTISNDWGLRCKGIPYGNLLINPTITPNLFCANVCCKSMLNKQSGTNLWCINIKRFHPRKQNLQQKFCPPPRLNRYCNNDRYSFRSNINPEKISNLETSFLLSHFFQ